MQAMLTCLLSALCTLHKSVLYLAKKADQSITVLLVLKHASLADCLAAPDVAALWQSVCVRYRWAT